MWVSVLEWGMDKGKTPEPLNMTRDPAFKAYFKKNTKLLASVLQDFLPLPEGYKIDRVILLDPEEPPQNFHPQDKTYQLDLKVRLIKKGGDGKHLARGETVNVEIQTSSHTHFTDRILAYAGRVYGSQLGKGEAYSSLLAVYSLVFTTYNLSEFDTLKDEYYHICDIRRAQPPHLRMTKGIQFIMVELSKFMKSIQEVEGQREAWCWFLKHSRKLRDETIKEELKRKGEDMGQAIQHLWKLSADELLREQLEAEDKFRQDHEASLQTSREEGRVEGREEERQIIALQMLKRGMDPLLVSEITRLSKAEIDDLED